MANTDVFISYKSEQFSEASFLKNTLEANGIRCWMAPASIPGGASYAAAINAAISNCRVVVLVLSDAAQRSFWIRKEVDLAFKYGKTVMPFMIENFSLNDEFNFYLADLHRYAAFENKSEMLKKMVREIQGLLAPPDSDDDEPGFHIPSPSTPLRRRSNTENLIGVLLDQRYELQGQLGEGGFSKVYLARDLVLDIPVAVKIAHPFSPMALEQLKRDVQLQKKCVHKHFSIIRDVIEKDDLYIVVMEYIDGKNLRDTVNSAQQISEKDAVKWGLQLADVLRYLHSLPEAVCFRDLKPSNVIINSQNDAVLIDFGAAAGEQEAFSSDTTVLGTAGYAPPEQHSGHADARSDIYALGMTLYFSLSGRDLSMPPYHLLPLSGKGSAVSPAMDYIIGKCCHPDPEQRYQTVEALETDLRELPRVNNDLRKQNSLWNRLFSK